MTREEALEFLRSHQPLPSDEKLGRDVIDAYDRVRAFLLANPDPDAVPLLLNAFGEGSGFGAYQLVEDVLAKVPKESVVPHLAKALGSEHRGIRYWSAQIAATFPDARLVANLGDLLQESDHDLRYAAITALEQVEDDCIVDVLRKALDSEPDGELRALLLDVLAERSRK